MNHSTKAYRFIGLDMVTNALRYSVELVRDGHEVHIKPWANVVVVTVTAKPETFPAPAYFKLAAEEVKL